MPINDVITNLKTTLSESVRFGKIIYCMLDLVKSLIV